MANYAVIKGVLLFAMFALVVCFVLPIAFIIVRFTRSSPSPAKATTTSNNYNYNYNKYDTNNNNNVYNNSNTSNNTSNNNTQENSTTNNNTQKNNTQYNMMVVQHSTKTYVLSMKEFDSLKLTIYFVITARNLNNSSRLLADSSQGKACAFYLLQESDVLVRKCIDSSDTYILKSYTAFGNFTPIYVSTDISPALSDDSFLTVCNSFNNYELGLIESGPL